MCLLEAVIRCIARNQYRNGNLLFSITVPLRNDILNPQFLHSYSDFDCSQECFSPQHFLQITPSRSRTSLNRAMQDASEGKFLLNSSSFISFWICSKLPTELDTSCQNLLVKFLIGILMNICAKLNICALNAPTSQSPKPLPAILSIGQNTWKKAKRFLKNVLYIRSTYSHLMFSFFTTYCNYFKTHYPLKR